MTEKYLPTHIPLNNWLYSYFSKISGLQKVWHTTLERALSLCLLIVTITWGRFELGTLKFLDTFGVIIEVQPTLPKFQVGCLKLSRVILRSGGFMIPALNQWYSTFYGKSGFRLFKFSNFFLLLGKEMFRGALNCTGWKRLLSSCHRYIDRLEARPEETRHKIVFSQFSQFMNLLNDFPDFEVCKLWDHIIADSQFQSPAN